MLVPIFFQPQGAGGSPGYVFCPPIRDVCPPWRKETPVCERRFHSHFRLEPRAINVHKLLDGTYVEEEGISPDLIEVTYRGAVRSPVTALEAASLVDAGYTVEVAT